MLFSALGMVIMTTANDLIVVFLALEILSIPLYVLAAFDRRRLELAGSRHQVLRARRVLLGDLPLRHRARVRRHRHRRRSRGIARVPVEQHAVRAGHAASPGSMLLLVGLGLQGRGGAVPHVDARRVPGRARRPVTTFMASATKAAGFAALLRVFGTAFPQYRADWRPAVWVLAVLTLAVGSIGAVLQTDIKRLLAYSSIAHAGLRAASAFQAATPEGRRGRALLPVRLHVHGRRLVRRRDRAHAARRRRPLHRELPRARRAPPGARVVARAVHAGAGRASRSPAASSPSSRCSPPPPTPASTCSS